MKLLEPTRKFIDAFQDGIVVKNHKFWFNLDLVFMANQEGTEERKRENFREYVNAFGIVLTYDDLMENFNIPFSVFIEKFKDVPEIYNSFDFKG